MKSLSFVHFQPLTHGGEGIEGILDVVWASVLFEELHAPLIEVDAIISRSSELEERPPEIQNELFHIEGGLFARMALGEHCKNLVRPARQSVRVRQPDASVVARSPDWRGK